MSRAGALALLLATAAACAEASPPPGVDLSRPVRVDLDAPPPERLSSYNLFAWDPNAGFTYNERVLPYEMNTALFTDYALKARAIYVPEGESAVFDADDVFSFPVGTVIVKSFFFPADFRAPDEDLRLIETRLLVHHADGWRAFPYIWDAQQRDAVYAPSGEVRPISFIDPDGQARTSTYLVPQRNQCRSCHERRDEVGSSVSIVPIGPKARYLHRDYDYGGAVGVQNQLAYFAAQGVLLGLPALDQVVAAYDFAPIEAGGLDLVPNEELDAAARDYLDINCAHCHNPRGVQGVTSQLFLDRANEDDFRLGVCKRPGSAGTGTGGLTYDIVPGDPDASILVFRTETEEVGAMMPLIGRSVIHTPGAALVREWVAAMEPVDCSATE